MGDAAARLLCGLLGSRSGAASAEYAILLGLVAAALVGGALSLSTAISDQFTATGDFLTVASLDGQGDDGSGGGSGGGTAAGSGGNSGGGIVGGSSVGGAGGGSATSVGCGASTASAGQIGAVSPANVLGGGTGGGSGNVRGSGRAGGTTGGRSGGAVAAYGGGAGGRSADDWSGGFRGGSTGGPGGGGGQAAGGSGVGGGGPPNGGHNGPGTPGAPDRRLAANANTRGDAAPKASLIARSGYYRFETGDRGNNGDFAPSSERQAGPGADERKVGGVPMVVAILCILALVVGAIVAALQFRRGRPRLYSDEQA